MVKLETLRILTHKAEEYINITKEVHKAAESSCIKNGLVAVITAHTTTGIIVNEALPCVETDISETLDRLVPQEAPYAHAHFLPSYGATGNNSTGHIKSAMVGNNCIFPLIDGKIVCGGAQDIYLAEFDGPQLRRVFIQTIGE
ncbi:secondary thiamine-phosphate synthase enzyme [Ruminiclostridium sufflavum DSM 19573]|uniref:Secondary thiamine-phosphate synthase enzyme n=1 Tax=Ruminiclostridium sufflavum DSM 19573 TaxID=1121337 RepID=A0A318XLG0_9FIRM|nr:secondary thiamine-phosphate synthase enzyme YjbQ [Ruminiclostridium sufflavum]PYG85924.1 secondary thiamine-phosphate synthase enzyme [Ruminiclostridium sufflavum DSM 19573]